MLRYFAILVAATSLAFASGCARDVPAPPPAPPPKLPTPAPATSPNMPAAQTSPVPPAIPKSSDHTSESMPSTAVPPKPPPEEPATKATELTTTETANDSSTADDKPAEVAETKSDDKPKDIRVAILTPGGPLVADIAITLDGKSQQQAFDELVAKVLAAADTDNDKRATWKELSENKDYLKTQPGGDRPAPARQLKMWTDEYDRNHDGQLQTDEAAAWLGRDAGVKARPFSVRSSRTYFSVPSAASRVWKLVDADDDGRLSPTELKTLPAALAALDDDADGVITPEEITSLREQLQVDSGRSAIVDRNANPFAALYLEPDFERDRLQYLLNDLYAPRQDLHPSSFPALVKEFQLLDADGNGDLDQDELARLLSAKPHLKLAVDFSHGDQPERNKTTLSVVDHLPSIEIIAQPAGDRVAIMLGATRLDLSAHDLTPGPNAEQATAGSQLRLMVHDQVDPLGEVLDANADGRLGEREIATSAERLLKFDANNNGQLDTSELPYTMIVAFLRGERPGEQSFYRPQSSRAAPASDVPSWFVHSDFNGDGDISSHEFVGALEKFKQLDANGDGFISSAEAKALTSAE